MAWRGGGGGPSKLFLVTGATAGLMAFVFLIFSQHNTKTYRTKHRLLHRHRWKPISGYNDSFSIKSNVVPDIPLWIPKLSRSLRESIPIPVDKLQIMFREAQFYSWPAVNFNSTVINNILGDIQVEEDDLQYRVPNIVHLTWFYYPKRNIFRFHEVICLLSIKKYIKPDKILFWYDIEPTGKWWQYIKSKVTNILMVYRRAPSKIFNNRIRVPEHKSDVVRLEAVLAFGGNSYKKQSM